MRALVLAAGRGARLRPLTEWVPKPMLPVHGKPLLEWVIEPLIAAGARELVFAVSYLAEQIENHFGDGTRMGAHIVYSESAAPSGKAGEIWRARAHLPGDEPFLVLPADTLSAVDWSGLLAFHVQHAGLVTIHLSTHHALDVGIAEVDPSTGLVTRFAERPILDHLVSTGIYVLDPRIFAFIEALEPAAREVDLPRDVFPLLLSEGERVYGAVTDAPFFDIGRIDDYERLNRLGPEAIARILHPTKVPNVRVEGGGSTP